MYQQLSNLLSEAIKKNRRKELQRSLEKFEELIPPEIRLPHDKELVDNANENLANLLNNRRMLLLMYKNKLFIQISGTLL